jgi:putative cofactor-binding repeat protein/parallel beta-helix repeat protein
VQNGDFETGTLMPWKEVASDKWTVASNRSHGGMYSAYVETGATGETSAGTAALRQTFSSPINVYSITRITYWYYAESTVSPNFGICFRFSDGSYARDLRTGIALNGWVQVDSTNAIKRYPGKSLESIEFFDTLHTKIWMDDVVISVDESLSPPLSPSPSAPPTVRIMPDGTVEGTDKIQRNGNIYTLTGDINAYLNTTYGDLKGFLLVMRSNVVIDGAGHTIQGNGTGVGIYLRTMQNVTIKNFNIRGFTVGISFFVLDHPVGPLQYQYSFTTDTLNNRILNNDISVVNATNLISESLGGWGIYLEFANNTVVSGNTIRTQDSRKGLYCGSGCYNTTFVDNKFVGCGMTLFRIKYNTVLGNTIDEKPIAFFDTASDQVIDGAEQVFLYNCRNMTVKNVRPSADYGKTIWLVGTSNSEVTKSGGIIVLTNSRNNTIHDNIANIITLSSSDHNRIFGNALTAGGGVIFPETVDPVLVRRVCIQLSGAAYNEVYMNTLLSRSDYGIQVSGGSQHNKIYLNNITNSGVGISLSSSSQISVFQNNITECSVGIILFDSSSNTFYHNNFINNKRLVSEQHESYSLFDQSYHYSVNNTWDNGYPSGGNYWSDYNGTDNNGDGIGDTPYIVYENKTDRYPLMEPFIIQEFPEEENPTVSPTDPSTVPPAEPPPSQQPSFLGSSPPMEYVYAIAAAIVVAVAVTTGYLFHKRRK